MSGDPANFPESGSTSSAANRTPSLKKRRGCGCFGSVTGAILLTILVYVGLNPWGLHIGQLWTPAMTWHGVGKLQSTTGAVYGLFLEVSPDTQYRRHTTIGGSDNLRGMAKLCTPQGEIYPPDRERSHKAGVARREPKAGDLLSPLTQKRSAQVEFRIVRFLAGATTGSR